MFTDKQRTSVWKKVTQRDLAAFSELLTPALLTKAAWEARGAWAGHPLNYVTLAWLAIACSMDHENTFEGVLGWALKILKLQPGFSNTDLGRAVSPRQIKGIRCSHHDPRSDDPTHVSEEAFSQARKRLPQQFWDTLLALLIETFDKKHAAMTRFSGLRLLSMDGTEINLPNYKEVRKYFGTAKNAYGNQQPQARMVMLQLTQVRLPLRYLLSPLSQGEITLGRKLTRDLKPDDLVLVDAGFWSYGLFYDVANRGAYFAIRKTRQLCCRTLKRLGPHDKLIEWTPKDSRGQWRKEGLPKSMKLRVIRYRVPGFRPQEIATNLLDADRVPYEDWVRLAWECDDQGQLNVGLYHRRWEIETTFRELKVRQGLEGNLRGRSPPTLEYEIAGHVLLYSLVRWLIVEAAVKAGRDPLRVSFSWALRELEMFRQSLLNATGKWVFKLVEELLLAIANHIVPPLPGRWFPRKKKSTNHKRKQNSKKINQCQKKPTCQKKATCRKKTTCQRKIRTSPHSRPRSQA
jgi:hypothetical protein